MTWRDITSPQDGTLQRQADFINQFSPGTIWENVIIIVKQVFVIIVVFIAVITIFMQH